MNEKSNPKDPDPKIWIKPDFWGKPKWIERDIPCIGTLEKIRRKLPFKDRIKYEEYFASQLRARYLDLEGDFRTIIAFYLHDQNKESELDNIYLIAFYAVDLLKTTKLVLEKERLEKVDLLSGSSLLDQAEQCMIWIMPSNIKIAEIETLRLNLDDLKRDIAKRKLDLSKETIEKLYSMLGDCKNELETACKPENPCILKDQEDACNAKIEGVIETLNKITLDDMINTGLQIERLRSLRYWGIVLLFLFILMFPMISNVAKWEPYNVSVNYGINEFENPWIKHWIPELVGLYVAVSFCIIGGIGGFLSGLLQVRSTRTNLGLYEENVLLFQIRPIFGAFAALVTFMLMSWGTLSQFIATSPGAYVMTAFLSGFSERYFLRLLMNLSEDDKEKPEEGGAKTKESEGRPEGERLKGAEESLKEMKAKTKESDGKPEDVKENNEVSKRETSKKEGSP